VGGINVIFTLDWYVFILTASTSALNSVLLLEQIIFARW
jgi:hypothetical protein